MTVGEMIKTLSQLDSDTEVINEDGDFINKVESIIVTDIFGNEFEYTIVR